VKKAFRVILLTLALAVLQSCNSIPVAEDLNQSQANEIVAALSQQGIAAYSTRATGGRARYSVEVKRSLYSEAVNVLNQLNLPSEPRVLFSDLVSQRALMPSSREMEFLRLDKALSVELEEALLLNPGIMAVKGLVRFNFGKDGAPPSASVIIKTREAFQVSEEEVRQLVQASLPGITAENVIVSVHQASRETATPGETAGVLHSSDGAIKVPLVSFLFFWRVPHNESYSLALAFLLIFLLVGLIAGFGGYWMAYSQRHKSSPEAMFFGLKSFADNRSSRALPSGREEEEKGKKGLPGFRQE